MITGGMKMKTAYRIISVAMVLLLLICLIPAVYSEGRPGAHDLQEISSQIEYPREEEYFKEYRYAEVRAPGGHSVFGFGSADHLGSSYTVLNGEKVKILAERKGYSCCIVLSQSKGRWINSNYLVPLEDDEFAPEEWVQLSYTYFSNGVLNYHAEHTYEDGICIEYRRLEKGRNGITSRTLEKRQVDGTGTITAAETVDLETGELISSSSYSYDEAGRLTLIQECDPKGNLIREDILTHGDDRTIRETAEYDEEGDIIRRYVCEYDLDSNPLRMETYWNGKDLGYLQVVSYDDSGKAIREHRSSIFGKDDSLESDVFYEYDENMVLLRTVEYYTEGFLAGSETVTEYVNDAWGNVLEEHRMEDGEEIAVTYNFWGLLKNGVITETSGKALSEIDGENPDSEKEDLWTAGGNSRGISVEETVLLDCDEACITATGYSEDPVMGGLCLRAENRTEDTYVAYISYLQINDCVIEPTGIVFLFPDSSSEEIVDIQPALLEAAGIERIDTISVAFKLDRGISRIFETTPVTISIEDNRGQRASSLIPIGYKLLETEKLRIELIGLSKDRSSATLYYRTENSSDVPMNITGGNTAVNGVDAEYSQFSMHLEPGSTVLGSINFYSPDSRSIGSLENFAFDLQVSDDSYAPFAEAREILLAFVDGAFASEEGTLTIDRNSAFWKEHLASAEERRAALAEGEAVPPDLIQTALNANGDLVYVVDLDDYRRHWKGYQDPAITVTEHVFYKNVEGDQTSFRFNTPIQNCVYFSVPVLIQGSRSYDYSGVKWNMLVLDAGNQQWSSGKEYDYVDDTWSAAIFVTDKAFDMSEFTVIPTVAPDGFGPFKIYVSLSEARIAFSDAESAALFVKTQLGGAG